MTSGVITELLGCQAPRCAELSFKLHSRIPAAKSIYINATGLYSAEGSCSSIYPGLRPPGKPSLHPKRKSRVTIRHQLSSYQNQTISCTALLVQTWWLLISKTFVLISIFCESYSDFFSGYFRVSGFERTH